MEGNLDNDGKYRPDSGSFDDMNEKPSASFSFDPKQVKNMENYKSGDTLKLIVKVRMPDMEEEGGTVDAEVVSIEAEPMSDSARVTRMRSGRGMGMGMGEGMDE